MSRRLRVLVLSYYAPPCGGPGVQRVENLLRYLPPDLDATVLTAAVEDYQALSPLRMPLDDTRELSAGHVHRLDSRLPRRAFRLLARFGLYGAIRWLWVPDVARRWAAEAVDAAARLHSATPFDVIFSTAPPFSAALAGRDCARRLRIPWVCDLQDLWTDYLLAAWPSRFHFARERALEASVLSEAAAVVMVTPGSRLRILQRYAWLSPERVFCVPYGYRAENFPFPAAPGGDQFVIVHTGVFCSGEEEGLLRSVVRGRAYRARRVDRSAHSPAVLLRAMERLGDPRVEFRHIGPMDSSTQRLFDSSRVRERIRVLGYRPHREALAELARADAAYLCLATDLDAARNELVPQKTYEYLGARRPVLAPIQDGDAKDLLEQAGTGFCASPYGDRALAEALHRLLQAKFEGRPLPRPREDFIASFEWSRLAARLFGVIERAAARGSRLAPVCAG